MHCACAILYCHLWPVQLCHNSPHFLTNGTPSGKKLLNTIYVFWYSLQVLSEKFLILRRIQRDITINVHGSSGEVPAIRVRLQSTSNFLDRLSKNPKISNLMKIRPVEPSCAM
jgi:hypothetical protein